MSLSPTTTVAALIALCLISANTQAAKPMTEDDLGSVSAVTGDNILNFLGAPAAGLTIDQADTSSSYNTTLASSNTTATSSNATTLTSSGTATSPSQHDTYQEGESTEEFATKEIKSLENNSTLQTTTSHDHEVDISAFEEAIYASKQTIRIATSLDYSNSEIRYFDKDMHHNLTIVSDNNVKISRDLQVDLLEVDKLNTSEDGPSAGSIYLSDWRSQGTTRIFTKN